MQYIELKINIYFSEKNEEDAQGLSIEEDDDEEEGEEDEETLEEFSQNGDINHELSCNSKRRVTDEVDTNEDNKKSKLDTEDFTSIQHTEEKTQNLIINEQSQTRQSSGVKKRTKLKKKDLSLVLGKKPCLVQNMSMMPNITFILEPVQSRSARTMLILAVIANA